MECIDHGKHTNLNAGGYGKAWLNGKRYLIHRLAYCDANGLSIDAIKGQVVRHTCDNPRCINPEHLLLGTQRDNMQDKVSRNRQAYNKMFGPSNGQCKLTTEQVNEIRNSYVPRCPNNSQAALAVKYGVSNQQISRIVRNKLRASL